MLIFSLLLISLATAGILLFYPFLQFHNAHRISTVFVVCYALTLLYIPGSIRHSTMPEHYRKHYARMVAMAHLVLCTFFLSVFLVRRLIKYTLANFLPDWVDDFDDWILIYAYTGITLLFIYFWKRRLKR